MHPLEQKVLTSIQRENLFHTGEKIVVGVSGGPDSVGLFHLLASLSSSLGISLIGVYVNHGLRPDEAANEQSYVQAVVQGLKQNYESVSVDVPGQVKLRKLSIEHTARELRYEALRKLAGQYSASWIAVGHTADDQAEEILIRLLRGSGRKGLSGMRMRNQDIVRPLLKIEKSEIISYLADKKISFLEDSSNSDSRFLRNRVRHELIPYLEEKFEAGVKNALRKSGECLAEDEELLDELTDIALDQVITRNIHGDQISENRILVDRKSFAKQPESLQRRIIERLLWQIGSIANYNHIVKVVEAAKSGRTGAELHLSQGLRVGVQRNELELVYPEGQRSWRGRLYPK